MSVRALSNELGRNYKNVHTDMRRLEGVGLIGRTKDYKVEVPWDIVETRLSLQSLLLVALQITLPPPRSNPLVQEPHVLRLQEP